MSEIPEILLSNGVKIPVFGIGTYQVKPEDIRETIKTAIACGYRHIDTAFIYGNEVELGQTLAEIFKEGTIKRSDLFITNKLWNTFHSPHLVRGAIETTLANLQTDYVDLYLMHWPFGFAEGGDIRPKDPNGELVLSNVDYVDAWRGMEKLVEDGLAKSIGLSNFSKYQIERILQKCAIPPVMNQIETNPYLDQDNLTEFCHQNGIEVTAYGALGAPGRPYDKTGQPVLLEDTVINEIAKAHNRTPAQILIRYQIQKNRVVLAKSITKERIISNIDVVSFELTPEEISTIDGLDQKLRFTTQIYAKNHKYYPFNDEF